MLNYYIFGSTIFFAFLFIVWTAKDWMNKLIKMLFCVAMFVGLTICEIIILNIPLP